MNSVLTLDPSEIHLWFVNRQEFLDQGLSLGELLAAHREVLTEADLARFERFHFDADKYQLLLTRVLLNKLLGDYYPTVASNSWQFTANSYGKPIVSSAELSSEEQPSFNISNSGDHIVIALSLWPRLGVDIEGRSRVRLIEKIAQRYFSPSEIEALMALPAAARQHRFYQLWTLKEAYIKACGMGLAIPLDHFSYRFDKERGIDLQFVPQRDDDPDEWQCWQLEMLADVEMGLAIKAAGNPIKNLRSWRIASLTESRPLSTNITASTAID